MLGPLPCDIVEGHRYADDGQPSWYSGQSRNPETSGAHAIGNPYDSGIHERPSGAFRLPEQRPYSLEETGSHARPEPEVRVPVRGPEYPTIKPSTEAVTPVAEPTSLVPPVVGERSRPESVYQSRRPVSSFLVAAVMVVLMIPVVRLLIEATFAGEPTSRAVVPAVLLTLGFTLTGIGLFTVARGGAITREAWLRPPVAYLPAGLILLFAAGLAVA